MFADNQHNYTDSRYNNNNTNNNRFRPYYQRRGRHRQKGPNFGHKKPGFRHQYQRQPNYEPDFEQQLIRTTLMNTRSEKPVPKYDTIVLELEGRYEQLTEPVLRKHIETYGTIKKIWFNTNNTKAFISFYNTLSVDMIGENGNRLTVNGQSVPVYPLGIEVPQDLCPTTDQSFHLKTICKTNNSSLSAMFPTKESMNCRQFELKSNLSRNQLISLISIARIDYNELSDRLRNTSDIREQTDIILNTILLTDSDIQTRNQLILRLEAILNQNGFDCRLRPFGSTVNNLGFRDSDIDLFVELIDEKEENSNKNEEKVLSFDESMTLLKKMQTILRKSLKLFIPKPIPSIRCPLVRLDFNELPNNRSISALVCDMSLSNGLGQHNSRLIRLYSELEPRFRVLCVLLRLWAKTNGFIGSNHMSSYAFTYLVIFFCQTRALLPSLDLIRQLSPVEPLIIKGWNCAFSEDLSAFTANQENTDSVLDLMQKFFDFYANFDFTNHVIRPKSGLIERKSEYSKECCLQSGSDAMETQEEPKQTFKLTSLLCIEDPFELTHNLCANLKYKTFDMFCDYLIYYSKNFKHIFGQKSGEKDTKIGEKDTKSEENSTELELNANRIENNWCLSQLCTEYDPTPNGYAFPEHFIGFANLELILNAKTTESTVSLRQLMQTMANNLIDSTLLWLTQVYGIETSLLAKWDVITGQLSPFGEFYIKLRSLDQKVIDPNVRTEFRDKLCEEESNGLSVFDREKLITERIIMAYNCERMDVVPLHLHFALVMNARICFPTVELAAIDVKPSFEFTKGLMTFVRRLIASAVTEPKLLSVANELVNI